MRRFNMKNVLITGGNGYIGENLERFLKEKDYNVTVMDKGMTVYDCDPYDAVVHLAALSGIVACQKDFKSAVWDNILTAFDIFDKARDAHIPVVFTSSQSAKVPSSSVYATMKGVVEVRAAQMNMIGGNVKVLRLANVYGGYKYMEKKNSVIKKMLNFKFRGGPIHVHGDGKQERDFIHVYDVCEYILRSLKYEDKIIEPVDIGTGEATSILNLARMMRHNFAFTDARDVGSTSSIADTSRAISLFDFKASNRVQEYIDEMIDLHSKRPVL
jgi:nucleoside-diphosphate-sugar epimerase